MVIQNLFCDEGGKYQTSPLVSFCGAVVSPSRLGAFNDAWQALLQSYGLTSFHMKDAANIYAEYGSKLPRDRSVDQTIDALLPFADCINENLEIGYIQVWDAKAYASLPLEAKAKLGGSNFDPHYLAFVRSILEVADKLGSDDRVSLVCDDDEVKAWDTYLHYRAICNAVPELRKKFAALSFADDRAYPALQAADMMAFLARAEALSQFNGKSSDWTRLFNYLRTEPKPGKGLMRWFTLFADEQKLLAVVNDLKKPLA